jgi:predicted dehydrogenase
VATQIVGVGILSYAHVGHAVGYTRALQRLDEVAVVAIYDEDEDRGRAYGQRFGVPSFEQDVDRLLARDDIQAVVVCSPTDAHADLVTRAARAGKHVLCEKPIATRLDDARAMIQACQVAGVQLHLAFPLRFMPMVQKAKQVIEAGEIGELYSMVGANRGIPPLPPAYPGWITDSARAGGGALMDHSVHVTDIMRYLSGTEAISVAAEAGTLFQPDMKVDDAALLLLRFDDDVTASVDPSWSIPAANPYHYDFFLRILGSDGIVTIDETRQSLQVTRDRGDQERRGFVLEPFGAEPDLELVRHFVRCLREGEFLPPAASGEDGLRALEIALAAYESVRLGQPVNVGGG